MMMLAMGLVCVAAVSGCKKKTAGSGSDGGIGGVTGADLNGSGLGGRPDLNATEMAGQFVPVYFDYDSAQVKESERAKVEAVAEHIKKASGVGVIVEGHCDERGSREYNLSLGERRAQGVRAYLMTLGVDAARIQTKSMGKEKPVALGHDEESWAKNRRAEFVLFK
ncbi:MAG: peptidoglycan-associated lipoprotein Pal [Verrucomicrobia bacterium]|nr:MAG: peptidoglycan-associated lipoprotein Pal [Verrucomicrobiota bacterium]